VTAVSYAKPSMFLQYVLFEIISAFAEHCCQLHGAMFSAAPF
jgi:hypothetical protein